MLATTLGRHDDAHEHFVRARERHDAYGAHLLAARTDLALAELCEARRAHDQAQRRREHVAATAAEHDWPALLARAQAASS